MRNETEMNERVQINECDCFFLDIRVSPKILSEAAAAAAAAAAASSCCSIHVYVSISGGGGDAYTRTCIR